LDLLKYLILKKPTEVFLTILFLFFSNLAQAQWEKVYEITDNNFYTIHALTNEKVLIGAEKGTAYRSENGGQDFSLTQLQVFGFIYSFAFEANKQVGYLGGGCYFTFDECPGNTIYKTIDGGESWELTFAGEDEFHIGVFIDIEIPAPDIVFAISDIGILFRSIDAGENWTKLVITPETEGSISSNQLQFFDTENGIAVVKYYLLGDSRQRLYRTSDAGETWTLIYETGGTNFPAINNLHFIDKDHGFLCTNFGKLEMTNDGGSTWTPIIIADEEEALGKVYFPTEQTGYVSSYNDETKVTRLYRTDDGGMNWALDFEKDSTFITDFNFSDSDNGYLFTGHRTVYRRDGTTSVKTSSFAEKFRIYPNPVNDLLFIKNDLTKGDYHIEISNAIGQILYRNKLNTRTQQVSTEQWGAGFYFIQIEDDNNNIVWSEKVIKNKRER